MIKVAIVGASGVVGQKLIHLLESSTLDIESLCCFASEKSQGNTFLFHKKLFFYETVENLLQKTFDLIFFCTEKDISKKWISKLKKTSTYLIDLSSAYRLDPKVPLIIPHVNGNILKNNHLISNPNCVVIILLTALFCLHKEFKIKKIVLSTYQAASGGGKKLLHALKESSYDFLTHHLENPTSLAFNTMLHESPYLENNRSEEEMKIILETQKILKDFQLQMSVTCVRVPVFQAHSLSIHVEFEKNVDIQKAYQILSEANGVKIFEDPKKNRFATSLDATENLYVLCSRLRKDLYLDNAIDLWVVADQLLVGAALNACKIAEFLFQKKPGGKLCHSH